MRLIEMEQENTDLKVRLADAESGNTGKDSEITKLRRRLQTLEKQNETLQHSNATYEQERRGLEREVWHSHLCRCIVVSIVLHKSLCIYWQNVAQRICKLSVKALIDCFVLWIELTGKN